MKLSDYQLNAIKSLYENNTEFQNIVNSALEAEAQRHLALAQLYSPQNTRDTSVTRRNNRGCGSKPGSKNHNAKLREVIGNGNISLKEIRLRLKDHPITHSTINSVVSDMKKKGEIIATGEHGNYRYSLA